MSTRTLLLSAGLLIACGAASSQPPQIPPQQIPLPGGQPVPVFPPTFVPGAVPGGPTVVQPGVVPSAPPAVTVPTPPPEKSVDQLLDELERLQAQKAELAKKEQELKATLHKKLEKQTERLNKLGVAPKEAKQPDRVGQIIIEGNTKTPNQKILDKVKLFPGQVLHYPALEEARTALEKAGFRGVKVEVVPSAADATFKDIHVTVDEAPRP